MATTVLYVALSLTYQVLMLDAATHQPVGQPVTVGPNPAALAVSPDGEVLYVNNFNSKNISAVETATGTVSTFGNSHMTVLQNLAVSPDGGTLYVANFGPYALLVIDTKSKRVVQVLTCSAAEGFGYDVAVTGDGTQVFVTAVDLTGKDGSVAVVNTTTLPVAVVQILPTQQVPASVAVAPDSARFYVANWDSKSISVFQATLVGGVSQ
jgi:DNA-binding beta-propeller fold protein YncE